MRNVRSNMASWVVATAASAAAAGCATGSQNGHVREDVVDAGCPDGCPPGTRCAGGRCVSGSCAGGCGTGEECCDGVCVNVRTDLENCGSCGNSCVPRGNGCFAGVCACNGAAACAEGRACCGESIGCVDIMADTQNCGVCFRVCDPGVECLAGVCGGSCLTGCPDVPHGATACAGERCAISSCDPGWADIDGLVGNGCECEVVEEQSGDSCDTAFNLGSIPDTGGTLEAAGFIAPATDEDWYKFTATDDSDTTCDKFYVDIRFMENPDDQYEFQVFVPDCATNNCNGDTRFSYAIDMNDTSGPEIRGQCPCSTTNTAGLNLCSDDSKTFYVKVRRAGTAGTGTSCAGYRLAMTNGVYSTMGP